MGSISSTTITTSSLLVIFLTVFFFLSSRNALQPTLSLYTDYLIWSPNKNPSSINPQTQVPAPPQMDEPKSVGSEGVNLQTQVPVPPQKDVSFIDEPKYVASEGVDLQTQVPVPPQKDVSFIDEPKYVASEEVKVDWGSKSKCDMYNGTWVKDEEYPIYQPATCPYVDEAFSCQANGRPDSEYLRWRWKPYGCDLPRFNATEFLERLKGKRLMLVGDSMNRNQFESILCLLWNGLSDKQRMHETRGRRIGKGGGYYAFKFEDYNCTVEYVLSHFLVREGTRINGQGNTNPTLSIDKIDKSAGRWKTADILVFNTGHWWAHGKTARGKNYYKEGDFIHPHFDATEAYRRAMRTWGKWIVENIDPTKKLVFYRGYSSAHFRGGDWDSGGTCNGETKPILGGAYINNYPLKMKIIEEVIQEMQVPVILLNVTRLTNFRKDGHPSVYGKNVTRGQKVSTKRQDCSHWCLPGVPDAWNELIYANVVLQQTLRLNQP